MQYLLDNEKKYIEKINEQLKNCKQNVNFKNTNKFWQALINTIKTINKGNIRNFLKI